MVTPHKSEWTFNTLYDHLTALIAANEENSKERADKLLAIICANDKRSEERDVNIQTSMEVIMASSEKAIAKAETASEKRFDSVNEFRATLADQQRTLMPRTEVEIIFKGLDERINSLYSCHMEEKNKGEGLQVGWGLAIGIVGIIAAIISGIGTVVVLVMK